MPEPATICLDDTVVALLVEGALPTERRAGIDRHLDACDSCRLMVAGLARKDAAADADLATRDERGGRGARPKAIELAPGDTIDRYVIVEAVGSGAMGTVYLARDPSLDRKIAIKVLRPTALDRDAQVRLLREAQGMAKVDHPNVVAVHDIGEHADQVFLALEYVGGGNLRTWLGGRRSWREIVRVYIAAARGLAAVHAAGLVHRDFKPDNVLLGADGSVHVGDFGLVSAATAASAPASASASSLTTSDLEVSLTATGVVVGTPAYMAPEQFLGDTVDARSDQFAFCAALFEALYGVRPFAGDDVASLSSAVLSGTHRAVARGDVPRGLHALVMRGLDRKPSARHASMRDVIAGLQRVAHRRRNSAAAIGGAAGVIALGIVIGFVVVRGRRAPAAAAVPAPCRGLERELVGIWDAPRRAAAGKAFAASTVAYAADTWTRVAHELDDYAAAWTTSQREACEATHVRHTQSEAVMTARMSCLADRKARLRTISDQLVLARDSSDDGIVIGAPRMVAALPPVIGCDLLTEPDVALAPPAAKWSEIAPVEDELRRLETLAAITEADAIPEVRAVVASADATGFAPLRARARHLLGSMLIGGESHDEAVAVLTAAVQLADEGRDDATRAQLLSVLALDAIVRFDRIAARGYLESWRAALARSGASPDGDMLFVITRAMTEMFEGKLADLDQEAARLDQLVAAAGFDFAERVEWLTLFGYAATEYAPPARQLAHNQQLYAKCKDELGPLHPATIDAELLVASALYYLHRYAEAEPLMLDVVAHRDTPGYDSGDEHIALGALYRETGRYDQAETAFAAEADDPISDLGQLAYQRGLLAYARGLPAKAIPLYREAQEQMATWLPADHPFLAQIWTALAAAERRRGKYDAALADARKARDILAAMDGENHRTAEALAELGLAAAALGQREAAIEALEAGIAASDHGSILPAELAEAQVALARLLAATDRDRALALARAAATATEGASAKWSRQVATDAAGLLARLGTR